MVYGVLFLIIGAMYYLGKDVKYKQRIKEYNKTGWYKESNRDLEVGLFHKYCFNYERGDKSCVQKKYWNFFIFNGEAQYEYCRMLAAHEAWKQGYRPYMFNFMPEEDYDFFKGFRNKYDRKVEEFNERYDKL